MEPEQPDNLTITPYTWFFLILDAVLRLPPMFLLEALTSSLGKDLQLYPGFFPLHKEADFDAVTAPTVSPRFLVKSDENEPDFPWFWTKLDSSYAQYCNVTLLNVLGLAEIENEAHLDSQVPWILRVIILFFGFKLCLFLFTLWSGHLRQFYAFLVGVALVWYAHYCNLAFLKSHPISETLENVENAENNVLLPLDSALLFHLASQSLLVASALLCLPSGPSWLFPSYTLHIFTVLGPLAVGVVPDSDLVHALLYMPLFHVAILAISALPKTINAMTSRFQFVREFTYNHGFPLFIEAEWIRLNVGRVFTLYWLIRLGLYAHYYYLSLPEALPLFPFIQVLLTQSCDSLLPVLGTAVVFGKLTTAACTMVFAFLGVDQEDSHSGEISTVLFILLAFQNGLSTLVPSQRFTRLFRNVCLLTMCFFHFVHHALDPLLMALAAAPSSRTRHLRALTVAGLIIFCPLYSASLLWRHYHFSTWLLAMTAFSAEVVLKVCVSLALYVLFLYDATLGLSAVWLPLDDYVYYVRSFGSAAEFLFGIFLFCNSGFILLFESGGAIRAALLCLHAYFNIWCEANAGWRVFVRRRQAVQHIAEMRGATLGELQDLDDTCAVCFQPLLYLVPVVSNGSSDPPWRSEETGDVRVTPCRHYFHAVCLRKWLYIQENCPLCQHSLSQQTTSRDDVVDPPDE